MVLPHLLTWFGERSVRVTGGVSQFMTGIVSEPNQPLAVSGPWPGRLVKRYDLSQARYRVPMAIAILSVAFQEYPIWIGQAEKVALYGYPTIVALGLLLVLAAALAIPAATSWRAIGLFSTIALVSIVPDWTAIANHTYLALWAIGAALLFKRWWESELYQFYLRATLGIIMIAAFSQKILAGTYVDGSYLTYLSLKGSTTEQVFAFLCDPSSGDPCDAIRYLSIFILAWQLVVGILLLAGLRSLVFLMIEIGFLLGAGFYADEMNFQILNIALLCIVFRYGMPAWLLVTCLGFLIADVIHLSEIADLVLTHVL